MRDEPESGRPSRHRAGSCGWLLSFDSRLRWQAPERRERCLQSEYIGTVVGAVEPFLGSGTTLAAAELTERVCYGLELDPKYVDVIVQRWQSLTGKSATLDGDGRSFDEIAQERRKVSS